VTGAPGVGKSRLAREVAREDRKRVAFVVDASRAKTPFDLATAVTEAIGPMRGASTLGERLVTLGGALLLLDDLREPSALDAATFAGHPRVSLLVTAPARLGLPGERRFALRPLAPQHAARLFVDRARAARHDYAPAAEGMRAIDRIVRRLDALPLAIELAAAMMGTMTEAELLASFPSLLRHDALSTAVARSWDALPHPARLVLARLSVFERSFTQEAAASVLGLSAPRALMQLSLLAEKSLVQRDLSGRPSATEPRFSLCAVVRAFARRACRDRATLLRAEHRHAPIMCTMQPNELRPRTQTRARFSRDSRWIARSSPPSSRAGRARARRPRPSPWRRVQRSGSRLSLRDAVH
jgi:predicted ATPase